MSEAVERRLLEILENPTHSPFGMPIPGLELLGLPATEVEPCEAVAAVAAGEYRLSRIGEPLQLDSALLAQLREMGLVPGAMVEISDQRGSRLIRSTGNDSGLLLDELLAQHIFVCVSEDA